MGRWLAIIAGLLVAGGIGFLAGYTRPDRAPAPHIAAPATIDDEVETAAAHNRDLERRIEQLTAEQERLARENETLRQQRATDQLLQGPGAELPERPPK